VPPRLTPVKRRFAPRWGFTVLALLAAAVCGRLGVWQWHKGALREAQVARFARGAERTLAPGSTPLTELPLFQRVSISGELDGAHQFLLENRSYQGRPGYEVLTPLVRAGLPAVLVDRGWVPFTGSRAHLPEVSLAGTPHVTLSGRIGTLPSPGLALGRAAPEPQAPWPKVTSYPDIEQLSAALATPLSPRILLLDPGAPFGYVRDWQAPGLSPLRHFSYAIQWWSFALLALIFWGVTSWRPAERTA